VKNLWAIGGGNGCAGSAAHEEKTHGDMTHDMHLQLQAQLPLFTKFCEPIIRRPSSLVLSITYVIIIG